MFSKADEKADKPTTEKLRSYLYRSQRKIDDLWQQIDARTLTKFSRELKLKSPILEFSDKSEEKPATLETKLQIVLRWLSESDQLGDLTSGLEYVRGEIPMLWREIDEYKGRGVLFSGYAKDIGANGLRVGLVGSASFVSGMSYLEPVSFDYLKSENWEKMKDQEDVCVDMELKAEIDGHSQLWSSATAQPMHEFVARVYVREDGYLLGSPLYVAQC